MIKKKVLVYGDMAGLYHYSISGCTREYDTLAVLADNAKSLRLYTDKNFPAIDIFAPEDVPNYVYENVEAVVLADRQNRQERINFLIRRGVTPRKIIPWNEYGVIEVLNGQDQDGTNVAMMEGLEFHLRNTEDINFFNEIREYLHKQRRFFMLNPLSYPQALADNWQSVMGYSLQWNNLQTWTEKMQWLKLFDATPLKSRLTDKYLVRYYVAERIGDEYLTPLLGVWDKFDDIDFDFLPEKFVLKCNHAPNFSIVVDKNSLDIRNLREKFTAMMQVDYGAQFTFELHYSAIKRRIIAEKLIEGNAAEYKFLCFNGKPIYCRHADVYYDMNWDVPEFETPSRVRKPKNFKLLKKLTEKLCGDFAFVRVDFKEIDNNIYFDALEFTPSAGMIKFKSDVVDKVFGELLLITTPPLLPRHNPEDYVLPKYFFKSYFAHKERITFPKVEPCNGRVIASLTSWTKRINTVHLALQTILAQSRPADLIVLYLADSEFPNREKDLPPQLTALLSDKFEIHWTENTKSYKKLIPALKEFPDDIIVTFDDDILYHKEIIERLLAGYRKYPCCVQCHRARNIVFDGFGEINPNMQHFLPYDYPTYLNEAGSGAGTLYPPNCFYGDISDAEKFMSLAPNDDELWFWVMNVLNGYRTNFVDDDIIASDGIPMPPEYSLSGNDGWKNFYRYLPNIFKQYPLLKEILWQEWLNAKPDD